MFEQSECCRKVLWPIDSIHLQIRKTLKYVTYLENLSIANPIYVEILPF